jgi:hypothetical protein
VQKAVLLSELGAVRQRDLDDPRCDACQRRANRLHCALPRKACANACVKLRI